MKKLYFNFVIIVLICGGSLLHASNKTGVFEKNTDVGDVEHPGHVSYNANTQEYTISGAGTNMWFGQDEFHYLYRQLSGDFILRANVKFLGKGVNAHRKLGWIVRNKLSSNSAHANACVHGDGLTSLQYRQTPGADTEEVQSDVQAPDVVQLERRGDTFIMSAAVFGQPFVSVKKKISLNDRVFAGLYVCSHDSDVVESAVFRNVRIVRPANPGFTPYRDYIGSHIEILNVKTGLCKILHSEPRSLQAPNWHPDGTRLIYNSEGLLYNFDLLTYSTDKLETAFATNNNNDHVLSFDGEKLGISHHSDEHDGQSIIYTLPALGGTPKQITEQGPSYLHGWSPDQKYLVYTAERNGQYDIYKISVDTKQEEQLTDTPTLDDGSEFTPDGDYIYFNSNRTGTMQIWRMRPDGSEQEQITFDEYNDWFPHISPDGKYIIFLSYMPEIESGDHPFYKHVYLRMMSVDRNEPNIVAYVYGGQGTMNVPSWSPDGRYVAFISNSKLEIP